MTTSTREARRVLRQVGPVYRWADASAVLGVSPSSIKRVAYEALCEAAPTEAERTAILRNGGVQFTLSGRVVTVQRPLTHYKIRIRPTF